MAELITERVCAETEGDIVIFLIGMRINKAWKLWRWIPVLLAMPRMLRELAEHPELGMLSARGYFGFPNLMYLQYWKSPGHLQAFAHSADKDLRGARRPFRVDVREHAALRAGTGRNYLPCDGTAGDGIQAAVADSTVR
jgi:hypothetical protein